MDESCYCIRYIDLPVTINAFTVMDSDGFYNIYVNSRLCYATQAKALRHEMEHIRRDDFYRIEELEEIENINV